MKIRIFGWLLIAAFAAISGHSRAADLTTLVSFNGTDGSGPLRASLIVDANGDLFGTTGQGGASSNVCSGGCGTVFEITKTASGYASNPTTLVSFNGSNGALPVAGLIADANGDLFGTTGEGGAFGGGTVFELARTASGFASTPTTLVSFCSLANCTDGALPVASLIADAKGNLFGTTGGGGASGDGTVFEITKTAGGYASAPTTLVNFDGPDGSLPASGLIPDANGNLFGTTLYGGVNPFPGGLGNLCKSQLQLSYNVWRGGLLHWVGG